MRDWPKRHDAKLIPSSTRIYQKIGCDEPRGHVQELVKRFVESGEHIAEIDCTEERRNQIYTSCNLAIATYGLKSIMKVCHINGRIYLIRVDEAIKHELL